MRERLNYLLASINPFYESISVIYLLGLALLVILLGSTACANSSPMNQVANSQNKAASPAPITISLPTEVTENTSNPLPDLAAAAYAGKPLYQANCALCHGDSGAGDGPAGPSFDPKPTHLTQGTVATSADGKMFLSLKNGKGQMPAMKKMTDEQMWQVVAYVRTLAR